MLVLLALLFLVTFTCFLVGMDHEVAAVKDNNY